jgi:hypothetical protein
MPHKKKPRRYLAPLVLFTLAGWALWALGRNEPTSETPDAEPSTEPKQAGSTPSPVRTRATWSRRRLATSLAFATLFFGGAAFSAGAGDVVADALEGETTTEVTSTEEAPAEDPPAEGEEPGEGEEGEPPAEGEEPPAEGEEPPAEGEEPPAEGEEPGEGGEEPPTEGEGPGDGESPGEGGEGDPGDGTPPPPLPDGSGDDDDPAPPAPGGDRPGGSKPEGDLPVLDKGTRSSAELDPEADADGFFATIWLHRPLPDPTPPAKRLRQGFADTLKREAERARVDWALVLGVLRARGFSGATMDSRPVRSVATRLADLGARRDALRALRAYGGADFADEALALRHYNRAVGLRALVKGLEAAKPRLGRQLLADERVTIYPGGRLDVAMGRVDVRVLTLLRYLRVAHKQVTVSSLISGHRLYSRPGVVSAHIYGLAVDIAVLEHKSIYGNQEPGGLTQRAVENILLLPAEVQAKQVISLLGLGGPSFPLADHDDHIHVGY